MRILKSKIDFGVWLLALLLISGCVQSPQQRVEMFVSNVSQGPSIVEVSVDRESVPNDPRLTASDGTAWFNFNEGWKRDEEGGVLCRRKLTSRQVYGFLQLRQKTDEIIGQPSFNENFALVAIRTDGVFDFLYFGDSRVQNSTNMVFHFDDDADREFRALVNVVFKGTVCSGAVG